MVGLTGLEPVTSRLSVERSSQLSYRPIAYFDNLYKPNKLTNISNPLPYSIKVWLSLKGGDPTAGSPTVTLLRLHPSR